MEILQSQMLLQLIHKFKSDLAVLEREIYATIPQKKERKINVVLIDPDTGKPFERKTKITIRKNKRKTLNQSPSTPS